MSHRPTSLALMLAHCPAALDWRGFRDPAPFATGTAAHEFLHALAEGRDLEALFRSLIAEGKPPPDPTTPMHPDAVARGHDLALAWWAKHRLPDGARAETALTFAEGFTCRVDAEWTERTEDEDGRGYLTAVVRDYKSAWSADESELDTLQRRWQAVAVAAAYPEAGAVRVEVGSLRRGVVYSRTVVLDEAGQATLDGWRAQILALGAVADGPHVAAPGAGCLGCPAALDCKAAEAVALATPAGREAAVRRWLVLDALADAAKAEARAATAEEPITVDGVTVGTLPAKSREVSEGGTVAVLAGAGIEAAVRAAGEVGVGWLEKAARALFPGRDQRSDREAWIEAHTMAVVKPRWGRG